jgi:uncharacterized protein
MFDLLAYPLFELKRMSTTAQSQPPSTVRRIFFNASELRAGWRLLIFIAIVEALIQGDTFVIHRLLPHADEVTSFLVFELADFFVFLLASWIMGRIEHRTIADYGLPWRRMFRGRFWQGALIGFATITALLLVMRGLRVFYLTGVALHGADIFEWGGAYTLVFILVALREEFRARGYALFTLSAGIGFWPAAIISSALFGYGHRGNSGEDWIGLVNAGLAGLLFCFLLRRSGDLWLPIGFHVAFDWGETYFYGVADSGNVTPGHLLNSASAGPAWLSGGTVGPEGSVLCTVLLIVVWMLCVAWLRSVKYPAASAIPLDRFPKAAYPDRTI